MGGGLGLALGSSAGYDCGMCPSDAARNSAAAKLFAQYEQAGKPHMEAHIEVALRYPDIGAGQFVALAVAAGHNRNNATTSYYKAAGAIAAMRQTSLDNAQTVEAAVDAYPAALAWAQEQKAAQGRAEEGAGALALAIVALRFAAVPAAQLTQALTLAHLVPKAHGHVRFVRWTTRRAVQLGNVPSIDPVLAAALLVDIPRGNPNGTAVRAARAAQDAAIAAARAKLRHPL